MKPLFNKYEAYNEAGGLVNAELQAAIDPVMEKWSKKGYKVKDIEAIAFDNVTMASAIIRMKKVAKLRLAKQEAEKKLKLN